MIVREPTPATLRKYGLSLDQWRQMLQEQGGVCAICRKVPKSGRLCIDHYHAKGFKHMAGTEKLRHVRGLCCSYCNRYKVAKLDLTSSRAVVAYLERHMNREVTNAGG